MGVKLNPKKNCGGNIDTRFFYAENITSKDWEDVSKYIVDSCVYKGTKNHKDVTFDDIMDDRNKQIWEDLQKYRNNPQHFII